jgi:hypothetical protein
MRRTTSLVSDNDARRKHRVWRAQALILPSAVLQDSLGGALNDHLVLQRRLVVAKLPDC